MLICQKIMKQEQHNTTQHKTPPQHTGRNVICGGVSLLAIELCQACRCLCFSVFWAHNFYLFGSSFVTQKLVTVIKLFTENSSKHERHRRK